MMKEKNNLCRIVLYAGNLELVYGLINLVRRFLVS